MVPFSDFLLEFMDRYGLNNLRESTVEQLGQAANMQFIGDPNSFLLAYATDTPSIEEPSAGYIFTWDMLENGILLPVLNYQGEAGTHSEFVEGLMAYDMKKTADDLAFFGYDAV